MDFITSDLHINHTNIIAHAGRPFDSVEHMNSVLINNWNQKVSNTDKVYVVGDFFMGPKNEWPAHRAKLNGKICLVMGNHDILGKKFTHQENIAYMRDTCGIEEVVDEVYYEDKPHKLVYWLNHFPPAGFDRHTDERGYKRPPVTRNYDIMVHGHTHAKTIYTKPNVIHVGADAHGFWPISFDELYDLVQKQPKK